MGKGCLEAIYGLMGLKGLFMAADPCSTAYSKCSAKYLLHIKCCKATSLQHLTAAEYCSCQFVVDFIPKFSYLIAVLNDCCISSVECLLHMRCYKAAELHHLLAAEYCSC